MIFWEKFMYHQSTLKIFLPQYLGMFAVWAIWLQFSYCWVRLLAVFSLLIEAPRHQERWRQSWRCLTLRKSLMESWVTMQIHSFLEQHISSESTCLPSPSNSCKPFTFTHLRLAPMSRKMATQSKSTWLKQYSRHFRSQPVGFYC